MAIDEDPILQALKAGSQRKDHLEKVFANLEVQRKEIMNVTMEWKNFKEYFVDLNQSLQE